MWGFTPTHWSFIYAGAAALAIPVIIHMLQSPTARIIDFPSIRFLKACQKKAVRRTRLKNILLMLTRMALVFLIALGMARCTRSKEESQLSPDAPVSMAIVLDNSYSMRYVDKGRSRFEQAREAALGLIGTLKPGDEVALLLMNEKEEPLVPELTADHERARAALKQARPSLLGTNVHPALAAAIRIVGRSSSATGGEKGKEARTTTTRTTTGGEGKEQPRRREVHVLTDLQASGWEAILKSDFLKSVATDATVCITSFGRKGSPNCFIESAAVAAAGPEQCTVTAQVWAVGAGSPGNVATLSVNDKPVAQETFAVRPGAPTPVTLTTRLGPAGAYRCVLSLQEDALTIDDQHFLTMQVGERSKVLVVDGDPSAIGPLGETFYLGNALSPGGAAAGAEGPPPVDARIVSAAEFPAVKLDDYRTVVLCNVASLDGADLVKLENFLREGGNLMVFLGGKVNQQHYNKWVFLPIALTQLVGDATKKQTFEFGEQKEGHALFRTKLDLRAARFWLCWGADRSSLKPGAAILQSFTNGQPALVEGVFAKGKVLLFTSACDAEWSNFPLRRAFLPWVHGIAYYLSGADVRASSFKLKDPVKFQAVASHYKDQVAVTVPTEEPEGRKIAVPLQLKAGYAEGVFTQTDRPGSYKVSADPAFTNSGGFGVNLDVKESFITMEDPEKIAAAAPAGRLKFVEGAKRDVVQEVKKSREEEKSWPTLFKVALLIFVVESLFGNLLSRAAKAGGIKLPLFELLRRRNPGVAQ